MNILGPDMLVFGVDDVDACRAFLLDYGLDRRDAGTVNERFCALDGTSLVVRRRDDPTLPPPAPGSKTMLRKTVYGVGDEESLEMIAAELGRDRVVKRLPDGSIEAPDDDGFMLGFQLTQRAPLRLDGERVNAPGDDLGRPMNHVAADEAAVIRPRTLSHVVYFVPDADKSEAFYVNRLGFRCTDRLLGAGPFLRPAGSSDHHCLFLIKTPPFLKGCEHFTFHLGGPSEVMQAGTRFINKGHESFWGPGRHKFGSNWFWYFKSPFGCQIEYDADMDVHDDSWAARSVPMSADSSQLFLFQMRDKWAPGGVPPQPGGPPG
jgi:catechol 2,3-dioxygenase-like lactoylglutathione lyase family enzyme